MHKKRLFFTALLLLSLLLVSCTRPAPGNESSGQEESLPVNSQSESLEESAEEPHYEVSSLPQTAPKYTNRNVFGPECFDPFGINDVMVIYVGFTDGFPYDEAAFTDMFTGVYEGDDCIRSVASYYRQNSGGRDLFNFHIFYYDSGMTCEEAWHLVNDEDENGQYYGNGFMQDVYTAVKAEHPAEVDAIDADRDGWITSLIFVTGEHLVTADFGYGPTECWIYGGAAGQNFSNTPHAPGNPAYLKYAKVPYETMTDPLTHGGNSGEYTRTLLHEVGHLFGLVDYYNSAFYEDMYVDTLGSFDMQSQEQGDYNPYSKFCCGWLSPYVITEDTDSITLSLHSSSLTNEAILIPTSKGWNGTPFDEYLLIDVMSPDGANGFDWDALTYYQSQYGDKPKNTQQGGVRIYHVDARLLESFYNPHTHSSEFALVTDIDEAVSRVGADNFTLNYANYNSNGYDPYLPEIDRFWHLVEIVPADGSDKFWYGSQPPLWALCDFFRTNDLFAPGETFAMETHAGSFPNGPSANNGGTFDYTVKVEAYDPETTEAIITITKTK